MNVIKILFDVIIKKNPLKINPFLFRFSENMDSLKPQKRNDEIDDCGLSSDRIMLKRIIGGNEARFAQFPWQVHIKIGAYQCGGVLG